MHISTWGKLSTFSMVRTPASCCIRTKMARTATASYRKQPRAIRSRPVGRSRGSCACRSRLVHFCGQRYIRPGARRTFIFIARSSRRRHWRISACFVHPAEPVDADVYLPDVPGYAYIYVNGFSAGDYLVAGGEKRRLKVGTHSRRRKRVRPHRDGAATRNI